MFAAALYIGMMGLWHIPRMYDLAVAHSGVHVLEHVCFITAGMLYWWHLLSPIRARMALDGMGPIVYMAVTKFFVGVLGIILAFSPHSLYPWYQDHPHYWGLSARVDQNLAGVVMALEQSVIMGTALVYIVYPHAGRQREGGAARRSATTPPGPATASRWTSTGPGGSERPEFPRLTTGGRPAGRPPVRCAGR